MMEIVDWSNSRVMVTMDYVDAIGEDITGKVVFAGYDSSRKEGMLVNVEKKPAEDVQQDTLTVGIFSGYAKESIQRNINDFNASQSEIFVTLKEYEDMTALHLDLIRGQGPDVLNMFRIDIDEYTEKGIIENLSLYMNNSDVLKENDILPALRECMSCDGGIRFLTPTFSIKALVVKEDVFPEGPLDTGNFLKQICEGEGYLWNDNAVGIFSQLYQQEQENYIDWKTKTCCFDDGRFKEFLESIMAADVTQNTDNVSMAEQIYNGTALSAFVEIKDFAEYMLMREIFEGYAEVKGYPNRQGKEIYPINMTMKQLAINSASDKKEEAWRFLEYVVLDDAERLHAADKLFSILKDTFETQLNSVDSRTINTFEVSQFTGEKEMFQFNVTDEERDYLRYMVDNACWDNSIIDGTVGMIIYSESLPYLIGEKTVDEVVDIIQSRVSIYMAE